MKLSSSTSDPFAGMFSSPIAAVLADAQALIGYYLRIEAAIATVAAESGLITDEAAAAVAAACDPARIDASEIERAIRSDATPIIALVAAIRAAVPVEARDAVHFGATSQDIIDTASMLSARDVVAVILADVVSIAKALASLARQHRSLPMVGRTMGQHAVPITAGAWAALRFRAVSEAAAHLLKEVEVCAVVQLAGPVGMGDALASALGRFLGMQPTVASWHTSRSNPARIASAAAVLAGELGALSADIILLSSSDVGELTLATAGGSSSMPQKRNPARAINARACAHRVPGATSTVLSGMAQVAQRDPGLVQAEWAAFAEVLQLTAACAFHLRAAIESIDVDIEVTNAHAQQLIEAVGSDEGVAQAVAVVDRVMGRFE